MEYFFLHRTHAFSLSTIHRGWEFWWRWKIHKWQAHPRMCQLSNFLINNAWQPPSVGKNSFHTYLNKLTELYWAWLTSCSLLALISCHHSIGIAIFILQRFMAYFCLRRMSLKNFNANMSDSLLWTDLTVSKVMHEYDSFLFVTVTNMYLALWQQRETECWWIHTREWH